MTLGSGTDGDIIHYFKSELPATIGTGGRRGRGDRLSKLPINKVICFGLSAYLPCRSLLPPRARDSRRPRDTTNLSSSGQSRGTRSHFLSRGRSPRAASGLTLEGAGVPVTGHPLGPPHSTGCPGPRQSASLFLGVRAGPGCEGGTGEGQRRWRWSSLCQESVLGQKGL